MSEGVRPVPIGDNGVCIHLSPDMLRALGLSDAEHITYRVENGRLVVEQ